MYVGGFTAHLFNAKLSARVINVNNPDVRFVSFLLREVPFSLVLRELPFSVSVFLFLIVSEQYSHHRVYFSIYMHAHGVSVGSNEYSGSECRQ